MRRSARHERLDGHTVDLPTAVAVQHEPRDAETGAGQMIEQVDQTSKANERRHTREPA